MDLVPSLNGQSNVNKQKRISLSSTTAYFEVLHSFHEFRRQVDVFLFEERLKLLSEDSGRLVSLGFTYCLCIRAP